MHHGMRPLATALALLLALVAAPVAQAAGLRAPAEVRASAASATSIVVRWKDRARGEIRTEVVLRRQGGRERRGRLAAGATRWSRAGLRPSTRYPIPPSARVEGGSDRHLLVLQRGACRLYELYGAARRGAGWAAGSGAAFDLTSNCVRPKGWTSADAAGLPILPGLARYDEVAAGRIAHALRFTVPRTQRGFIFPARHLASDADDPPCRPWACACG